MLNTLEDPEYRREFVSENMNVGLAFQIRHMRESRGWTQEDLARRTGKAQETISAWESQDYGRYSLSTLKTLAAAFDVALLVRFVSFTELVDWTIGLTPERLAPPSYDHERKSAALIGPSMLPAFDNIYAKLLKPDNTAAGVMLDESFTKELVCA